MSCIVILGTGGTIAGSSQDPDDNVHYTAGVREVGSLVAGVPALRRFPLELEQLAQLDSKDMDDATWLMLARAVARQLSRAEVQGVVITHGSDTLEETAWFLQRVLAPVKPVVLTAAMRPATALLSDGPQNLLDAVRVASDPDATGVLAVLNGRVWAGHEVRKRHPYRVDAFDAGDRGALGMIEEGRLRLLRPWPTVEALGPRLAETVLASEATAWPWVEVISSHAGARPDGVRALLAAGVQGLVLAATGNGTVNVALEPAMEQARAAGVPVWVCSRCGDGVLVGDEADAGPADALTPWQARVALMVHLLAEGAG